MPSQTKPLSFNQSLKHSALEEFIDFYFYRRIAFLMVPAFIRLGFSPNQVTLVSMLTGLTAAYSILNRHFWLGALLAVAAICFDCCDGQVARLTGKSSPLGRMMDGICDLIWVASVWLAIYFSGYFQGLGFGAPLLALMIAAGGFMILHCWRFDGIRIQFFKLTDPKLAEQDLGEPRAKALLKEELRRLNLLAAFLAGCVVLHAKIFVSKKEGTERELPPALRAKIRAILEPGLSRWPWLGEGHHNTLLIFGLLTAPAGPYGLLAAFWMILIPMNLWWAYCEWEWRGRLRAAKTLIAKETA